MMFTKKANENERKCMINPAFITKRKTFLLKAMRGGKSVIVRKLMSAKMKGYRNKNVSGLLFRDCNDFVATRNETMKLPSF